MANAAIDANGQATLTARLNTDGVTVVKVKINATSHALKVDDGSTGSDNGGTIAATDDNERPTMFAVSNADGKTLVPLYVTSAGLLLIKST